VGADVKNLAREIASCASVSEALLSTSHPCSKVVREQDKLISVEIKRQRPEPWFGNLEQAKLLFVSSNPSINEDPYPLGEVFPTYEWSEDESANFFVNRCNQDKNPPYVTFKDSKHANFSTLCHDGEYRGKGGEKNQPVDTWLGIHMRAMEILGPDCHPHFDYALTEVVKCKSKSEMGVKSASAKCKDMWMSRVLNASTAQVIVVIGAKSRDNFAHKIEGIPSDFGTNPKTYAQLSTHARALRDIKISNFGGKARVYVYNWLPTSYIPEKKEMLQLKRVYGERVVNWLSDVAHARTEVPKTNEELTTIINLLFKK